MSTSRENLISTSYCVMHSTHTFYCLLKIDYEKNVVIVKFSYSNFGTTTLLRFGTTTVSL